MVEKLPLADLLPPDFRISTAVHFHFRANVNYKSACLIVGGYVKRGTKYERSSHFYSAAAAQGQLVFFLRACTLEGRERFHRRKKEGGGEERRGGAKKTRRRRRKKVVKERERKEGLNFASPFSLPPRLMRIIR